MKFNISFASKDESFPLQLGEVTARIVPADPDLQDKTVTPTESTQTVTCDAPHDGLGTVTVNPIPPEYVIPDLQDKTVTPMETAQTVTADAGKTGLSSVTVNRIPEEYVIPSGAVTIDHNGVSDVAGYASADVHVSPVLQRKSVTPTRAAQTVEPDSGKDGLSAVEVGGIPSEYVIPTGTVTLSSNGQHDVSGKATAVVDVQPVLQSKSVTPTRAAQTVTPDSGKDGLSAVEVGGIPSEYVVPEGTKQIAANGVHDVSGFASAEVAVPGPSGQIEITENGEVDVAAFASALVNVAGGGASNVVAGKITTPLQGGTIELPSDYAGNGYPILVALGRSYAKTKGILNAVVSKQRPNNAPQYAKGNADLADMLRTGYNTSTNYSGTNAYVYADENPVFGLGTWMRIKPGNKVMVVYGSSGYNVLAAGETYYYVILYSE